MKGEVREFKGMAQGYVRSAGEECGVAHPPLAAAPVPAPRHLAPRTNAHPLKLERQVFPPSCLLSVRLQACHHPEQQTGPKS